MSKELTANETLELFQIALDMREEKVSADLIAMAVKKAISGDWEIYPVFKLWQFKKDKDYRKRIIGQIEDLLKRKPVKPEAIKTLTIAIPENPDEALPNILYPKQFYSSLREAITSRITLKRFSELLKEVDPTKQGIQQTYLYRLLEKDSKKVRRMRKDTLKLFCKALHKADVKELTMKVDANDLDRVIE